MLVPVLLSGGLGRRLWPYSGKYSAKQFINMLNKSLFELSIINIRKIFDQKLFIVTNHVYQPLVLQLLNRVGENNYFLILEKDSNNTAFSALCVASLIRQIYGNIKIWIQASDHIIENVDAFQNEIKQCVDLIDKDSFLIFGSEAKCNETNYGYINAEEQSSGKSLYNVIEFKEKPDLRTISKLRANKNLLWHMGYFLCHADNLISLINTIDPQFYKAVEKITFDSLINDQTLDLKDMHWPKKLSIDKLILEKTQKLKLYKSCINWLDIGNWDNLFSYLYGCELNKDRLQS